MNFKLWLSLLAALAIPSIYTTVRVFFLNTAPDTGQVNIAAQSAWLGLVYEVIAEALLVPLYFVFGQVIKQPELLKHRVFTAFKWSLTIYAVATIGVWIFTDSLHQAMRQQESEYLEAARFIRLEALSFMMNTLNDICLTVLTTLSLHRWISFLILARALLTVALDTSLVSQLPWSMQLGVTGVALTNLITGALLFGLSYCVLRHLHLIDKRRVSNEHSWVPTWLKIASYSGLEAALRNTVYALVILRLINQTGAAPLYWNANQLLWAWLLLPVLALGQVVRQDTANPQGYLDRRIAPYAIVLGVCITLWIASQPAWDWLICNLLGLSNPDPVHALLKVLLPFYAVFAVTHLLQNYLYGMGRTDLIFSQSIVVNVIYYGTVLVMIQFHRIEPSLQNIVWIFGAGMCLSLVVTLWQFRSTQYFQRMQKGDPLLSCH